MVAGLLAKRSTSRLPPHCLINFTRRNVHSTPVLLKKKAKVEIEDLFADDDLIKPEVFSESSTLEAAKASTVNTTSASTSKTSDPVMAMKKGKLSPEQRAARFEKVFQFVSPRIGRQRLVDSPSVRKTAWVQLLQLATTETEMERVAEMLPRWQESGYRFDATFSEQFVQRCEELSCPLLALKVYGNYAKYNIPLSLPAARQLLHSLHLNHSIDNTITTAALYDVYGLPPVTSDIVSCSLLISACLKHDSKDSQQLVRKLLNSLEELVRRSEPLPLSGDKTLEPTIRPWVWVEGALKKIDKVLSEREGKRVNWLSMWREHSGYGSASSML